MQELITLSNIALVISDATTAEPFIDALAVLTALHDIQFVMENAWARWFREQAAETVARLVEGEIDAEVEKELDKITSVIEDTLALNAADDFDSYCLFTEWHREPAKKFYQPRRRVLYPLVCDMQDLADGRIVFLSISMPPRTGKSTIGIFFLTWIMGKHPTRANVMSGHSDKLTKGFHMEALSLISDSTNYRFGEVFPEARLIDKSMADETINLKTRSRFPTLTCRSVEGTLTGAVEVGRDAILYMDDLVEDREEALNADRMDKLYSAYLNQLKDRMNDGAKQLFVATRWVPNDPIGRIEEQYAEDPRYRFTVIPALNEHDESNFVYDYNLGFSTEYYLDMRASLIANGEEDSWSAKYMGHPYYIGGLMFPEDELNYYDELPEGEPDAVIAVCDTKDRGSDYACQPIGYIYGNRHYIHAVVCDNSLPEVVEPRLARSLVENNVSIARYESNSAGGRIADSVKEACEAQGHTIEISKKFSTENKETRILVDSLWIKQNCYFRENYPDRDYARFMRMLTHYTTEGKNKHDDAPDSMSMYKRFASALRRATVQPMKRPF